MKKCIYCGTELADDAEFCMECGKKQSGTQPHQEAYHQLEAEHQEPEKKLEGTEKKPGIERRPGTERRSRLYEAPKRKPIREVSSDYAAWCRLGREQKSIYEIADVSEDEFMERVNDQLKINRVPVTLRKKEIYMDGKVKERYTADVMDEHKERSPLTIFLRYARDDMYSFVSSSMFVRGPELLQKPGKKPESRFKSDGIMHLVVGILMLFIGIGAIGQTYTFLGQEVSTGDTGTAVVLILLSLALLGWGGFQLHDFIEHLKKLKEWEKQAEVWNNAWDNWQSQIGDRAMADMVSGDVPFVYEEFVQAVQKVCHEVFTQGPISESFAETTDYELRQTIKDKRKID